MHDKKPVSPEDKAEAARQEDRAKIGAAMRTIDWVIQTEIIGAQARTAMMKYKAARKEGFDVRDALELCIKPWSL